MKTALYQPICCYTGLTLMHIGLSLELKSDKETALFAAIQWLLFKHLFVLIHSKRLPRHVTGCAN